MRKTRDFWCFCGHHLLDRDRDGRLLVTDEFLKAYLARPELVPPADACPAERRLHSMLLCNPRQPVASSDIDAVADADARENWELVIAWRDQLAEHLTLEGAYLDIARRALNFPPVFVQQLVQVILRNALDGCTDVFMLRAAELLFRPQKLALLEGSLVAADEEAVSRLGGRLPSPLVALLGPPSGAAALDVLNDTNAHSYWERSDLFDMGLDLTAGRRGLAALGDVVARWISHLLAVDVAIEPLTELRNLPFTWYVGLDRQATRIGDVLWEGGDLDDDTRTRMVGLYRLTFVDPEDAIGRVRGEPVYLIVAMTPDNELQLKPQNLVSNLPAHSAETVN